MIHSLRIEVVRMRNEIMMKLASILKAHRRAIGLSLCLAIVSVSVQLLIPVLFGSAIDGIHARGYVQMDLVLQNLAKVGLLLIVSYFSTWVMNQVNNRLTYETIQTLRARAIRKIQVVPISYLDTHSTGDMVQRIISDTDQISDGLLLGFSQLFSGVIMILVTLVFMFMYNVWITCFVIVCTPFSFLVAQFISKRSYRMFRKQTRVRGQQSSLINEMVGQVQTVQSFGYQKRASKRFEEINGELSHATSRAIFFSSLTNPSTRFVNNVIYAGVAALGAYMILQGRLSVGGLVVLLAYANQYMKPFNDISSVLTELQNSFACAKRIFDFLEAEEEVDDQVGELELTHGAVELKNVYFSYVPDQHLIEDLNISVPAGSRVAIVGPTGCGKTTLIHLLMRFYEVNQGTIEIDGQDISKVSKASLRSQFGMVLQETWLQEATIRENLMFGLDDASDADIIEAAKRAHSWEFIRRLPKQLDTVISSHDLSQGQRQLLCITRVMLMNPPMLILDEATSSIDTRTEVQVQDAFDQLMEGKTSFIVAHRLSTIKNADQIVVMKDGCILEKGTHDDLLEKDGFYAQLYRSSFLQADM